MGHAAVMLFVLLLCGCVQVQRGGLRPHLGRLRLLLCAMPW